MSLTPKCTVYLTFSVRRKQKISFFRWLQCRGSVKHLTSITYNAGKIMVQCFPSVEEFNFKPQPLPFSDVFVPALRLEVFYDLAAI